MTKGRFIVLEGPDGAGKSTQLALLRAALEKRGVRCLTPREPGGTAAGEAIRALLLEKSKICLSSLSETFLFQAARAQLIEEVVRPALVRGTWVLCDRFTLSTLAYQGHAGGMGRAGRAAVEQLSDIASGGVQPDLYFVLWVSPREALKRRQTRGPADRMESKGQAFLRKVSAAYRSEIRRGRGKYIEMDGSGAPEKVQAEIWRRVERLLKRGGCADA